MKEAEKLQTSDIIKHNPTNSFDLEVYRTTILIG